MFNNMTWLPDVETAEVSLGSFYLVHSKISHAVAHACGCRGLSLLYAREATQSGASGRVARWVRSIVGLIFGAKVSAPRPLNGLSTPLAAPCATHFAPLGAGIFGPCAEARGNLHLLPICRRRGRLGRTPHMLHPLPRTRKQTETRGHGDGRGGLVRGRGAVRADDDEAEELAEGLPVGPQHVQGRLTRRGGRALRAKGPLASCTTTMASLGRPTMPEGIKSHECCGKVARHAPAKDTPGVPGDRRRAKVAQKLSKRCSGSSAQIRSALAETCPAVVKLGQTSPKFGPSWAMFAETRR